MKRFVTVLVAGMLLVGCSGGMPGMGGGMMPGGSEGGMMPEGMGDMGQISQVVEGFLKMTQSGMGQGGGQFDFGGSMGGFLGEGAMGSIMSGQDVMGNVKDFAQIPDASDWTYQVGDVEVNSEAKEALVDVIYSSSKGDEKVSFMMGLENDGWKIKLTE